MADQDFPPFGQLLPQMPAQAPPVNAAVPNWQLMEQYQQLPQRLQHPDPYLYDTMTADPRRGTPYGSPFYPDQTAQMLPPQHQKALLFRLLDMMIQSQGKR